MRAFLIVIGGISFREGAAPTPLVLPALDSLGWKEIAVGRIHPPEENRAISAQGRFSASYGRMLSASLEIDTISAHWQMAGVIPEAPFTSPERIDPALWTSLGIDLIGNCRELTPDLLRQHHRCAQPILLTRPDSRLDLIAHRAIIDPARLSQIGHQLRSQLDALRIHRLIVRPMEGSEDNIAHWTFIPEAEETLALPPPRTLLNALSDNGLPVEALGNTVNFFAHSGITRAHPSNHPEQTLQQLSEIATRLETGLVFASLTGMNSCALNGHPTQQLQQLDAWLPSFLQLLDPDDLLILTSDHGCATGPVREEVPLIIRHRAESRPLGLRLSYTDIASTLAAYFRLPSDPQRGWPSGEPLIYPETTTPSDLLLAGT